MNKLTLAVAAYRVETFLPECLESIAAQTCREFDILLIDDGSPDRCGEIIDRFAQGRPGAHAVHQPNAGISVVRNRMIDMCETEYLWMIDGDDTIPPEAVERLLPCLDGEREAVYFSYANYGAPDSRALSGTVRDLGPEQLAALRRKSLLRDGDPSIREINANSSVMSAFLVRSLRENSARFEPGLTSGEDVLFTARFLSLAKRAAYLDASLYRYRVNENSVTQRYSPGLTEKNLRFMGLMRQFADERYPGDARMRALLDGRVLGTARASLELDICHPHNKQPRAARRAAYRKLVREPQIASAIRECPEGLLRRNVKVYRACMRLGWFWPADLFARTIMTKRYMVFRARGGKS